MSYQQHGVVLCFIVQADNLCPLIGICHPFTFAQLMMCAKSLQLCPTLCHPVDHTLPDSTVMGFSRQE